MRNRSPGVTGGCRCIRQGKVYDGDFFRFGVGIIRAVNLSYRAQPGNHHRHENDEKYKHNKHSDKRRRPAAARPSLAACVVAVIVGAFLCENILSRRRAFGFLRRFLNRVNQHIPQIRAAFASAAFVGFRHFLRKGMF